MVDVKIDPFLAKFKVLCPYCNHDNHTAIIVKISIGFFGFIDKSFHSASKKWGVDSDYI